jgi:hypothetical protein
MHSFIIDKTLPDFKDCTCLTTFFNLIGEYLFLCFSNDTDDVYLFDGNFRILMEFSSGGEVYSIATDCKTKIKLGSFTAPHSNKWDSQLEFTPNSSFSLILNVFQQHAEAYIEREKKLCKFLINGKDPQILKDFIAGHWDKFPKKG